jgi:hypothetical protein
MALASARAAAMTASLASTPVHAAAFVAGVCPFICSIDACDAKDVVCSEASKAARACQLNAAQCFSEAGGCRCT